MFKDGLGEKRLLEEEYFYKKDRELIEKMKESEKQRVELLNRTSHYHKCGCCGHDMNELVHEDVSLLQCQNCDHVHVSLETLESLTQGRKLKNLITEISLRKEAEERLLESA